MKVKINTYVTGDADNAFNLGYPKKQVVSTLSELKGILTSELRTLLTGSEGMIKNQGEDYAYALWHGCDKFQAINRLDNNRFAVLEVERI